MLTNLLNRYNSYPRQVKASFWFLFCAFLQKGMSVITTPIFTRLMSADQYGSFSVFTSWMSIASVLVTLNIGYGVYTQGLVKFEEDGKVYTSSLQGLTLTMCILWTGIYLLAPQFWNEKMSMTTPQALMMFALIWTSAVFVFWSTEQRVLLNYKSLVIVSVTYSLLQPILGVIFVYLAQDKVTARIVSLLLVDLLICVALFIIHLRSGKHFFSSKYWKYALLFNIPLLPHYLSQVVLSSANRIMINDMVGATEAGIYSLAFSVSWIMIIFNTALMQTITPWIYRKIKDKRTEDISPIASLSTIIIAVVNLLLILLAPEAIRIFAPPSYFEAIWIVPPVALSVYFNFAYTLYATYQFYYKKTVFIAMASIVGAVLNVALNYWLIPIFGYMAAGYNTLICYIVYSSLHYLVMSRISKREEGIINPFDLKQTIIISGSFVLIGLSLQILYPYTVLRYIVLGVVLIGLFIKRNTIKDALDTVLKVKKQV